MKQPKWLVLCGGTLLATAIACGTTPSPTAPASTVAVSGAAGASGETLKIGAPTPQSPINNVQLTTTTVVLTYAAVTGTYSTFTPSYQIELKNPAGTVVANPTVTATTYTVTASMDFDTIYTWRVRATYLGGFGPWSSTATFKTQNAGYMIGNTVMDPLFTGRTVGERIGVTTFVPGQGLRLDAQTSTLRYQLPATLTAGEFSVMILGADEGSAGGKSKVFSMQEGVDGITDNDYRATIELRARDYPTPGAITCRIITGDSGNTGQIFDCPRIVQGFNSSTWYFWKFSWGNGRAGLQVRENNETGKVIYDQSMGIGSHAYGPVPHVAYLGAPVGRAGEVDATIGGGPIYKNVWIGPTARPNFPSITALTDALLKGPGGN